MKTTLIKLSFYAVPIIILLLILGSFADGNTDDNYRHFAVQKPKDIILGDSRATQAINPYVLDSILQGRKFDNFALNITHSPYGPVYLKGLKRKLNPDAKNGIFILTVDPWNLSTEKKINTVEDLPEKDSPLNNMFFYDMSPNYEYLLKNLGHTWYYIYRDREEKGKSATYVHENGWLEVNVDMNPKELEERAKSKTEYYKELGKEQKFSNIRLEYFEEIIKYLQSRGTVYIVRIPASEGLMLVENQYYPDFNQKMKNLENKYGLKYIDFSEQHNNYIYLDGSHMYKRSGKIFTTQIADSIKKYQLK